MSRSQSGTSTPNRDQLPPNLTIARASDESTSPTGTSPYTLVEQSAVGQGVLSNTPTRVMSPSLQPVTDQGWDANELLSLGVLPRSQYVFDTIVNQSDEPWYRCQVCDLLCQEVAVCGQCGRHGHFGCLEFNVRVIG